MVPQGKNKMFVEGSSDDEEEVLGNESDDLDEFLVNSISHDGMLQDKRIGEDDASGDDDDDDVDTTMAVKPSQQEEAPPAGNKEPSDTAEESSEEVAPRTTETPPPSEEQLHPPKHWPGKCAANMARNTCIWFAVAWVATLALSFVGLIVGNFEVAVDNAGWVSRGTLIADRTTQISLIDYNRYALAMNDDNDALWDSLINNVQPGWESEDDDIVRPDDDDTFTTNTAGDEGRQLLLSSTRPSSRREAVQPNTEHGTPRWNRKLSARRGMCPAGMLSNNDEDHHLSLPSLEHGSRFLQAENASVLPGLEGCDGEWYLDPRRLVGYEHLWPLWRPNDEDTSALEGKVIRDICRAEINTQKVLKENDLCYKCSDGECLPPFSLVFFARLMVWDFDLALSCDELATRWDTSVKDSMVETLAACVADIKASYDPDEPLPESCPFGFHPALVDNDFSASNPIVRYTSTIFMTNEDFDGLWDAVDEYDRAADSEEVRGVYDTQYEFFVQMTADDSLVGDMSLALGSAVVTGIAILVHTRSPWLTALGLCQIILSFPLAYFVYSLVAQLQFFPFLNFIGVFVVFAIGADDIFVAVDKWKNARLEHTDATTEQVAAIALPDAAESMFLTSITTAVAFFGTAICPVAPLKLFAVFNGLLIMFDYFLCVFLIFPALCLYDKWLLRGHNRCLSCHCCHRLEAHGRGTIDGDGNEAESESLIRRILTKYYDWVHYGRYALVALSLGAIIACGIVASTLALPDSSDVRILDSSNEHEKCYEWRLNLVSSVLEKQSGSRAHVIWGVTPADTGDHNNPDEWSQLVLDEDFNPSSEAAQKFLLSFCPTFFGTEFAERVDDGFGCSINKFDLWLEKEAFSDAPSQEYTENCQGATGLPMPEESFDVCIIAWSRLVGDTWVLQRNGAVVVIILPYQSRVRYDSKFDILDKEWKMIESWMSAQSQKAPIGVKKMFQSSDDYWWYDTNGSILSTAYGSAGIALGAAAIVMLISSRSFEITLFALITIGFILISVTSLLVASGWTLGFLESVCFAILIGVSCDFVIHFSHAYSSLPGDRSRHERSKYALLRMGPSILAAAFTTLCAATVMIFTVITFFQKFAQILFYTIIMATVGSFVVFITLADACGPSRPTVLVDAMVKKICCGDKKDAEEKARLATQMPKPSFITKESERIQL